MAEVVYNVNDVVEQYIGSEDSRLVRVTEKKTPIKNGRPGFYGVIVNRRGDQIELGQCWGYDDDILDVRPFAEVYLRK